MALARETVVSVLAGRLGGLALRRPGQALCLWGEAGIGKSWTAWQLIRQTPCKSVAVHATAPLAILLGSLPRPRQLPVWAERSVARLERGEALETDAVADALAALLAASAPMLMHVEDLHEAGPERVELWQRLARMVRRSKGVALLVTSRTSPPEPYDGYRVEPLDARGSGALLQAELGPMPAEAANWVFERARGNPLFTLEYLRFLTRQGQLWNDGQRWRWREPPGDLMPGTVEALIEQKILEASADETVLRALEARSMLSGPVSPQLWAQVAGLAAEQLEDAQARLVNKEILRGDDFAHPLFREVRFKTLRPERRQALARRALGALQDDPGAAAVFVEDAGLHPAEALERLVGAALAARQAGRNVEAARFQARAAGYASGKEGARLALAAAQGLRHVDVPDAIRLAGLASRSGKCREAAVWLIAELQAVQGQQAEAERTLLRLDGAERLSLPYLARLVQLRGAAQDFAGTLELLRAHPALLHNPDPVTAYRAGWALVNSGFSDEAERVAQGALSQPGLGPEAQATLYKVRSLVCYFRGDYAGMERHEADILELARLTGNLRLQDQALFNRALALESLGRYAEQQESLEGAMQTCLALGDTTAYVIAQSFYGSLLTELGEYVRAEEALTEARAHLRRTDLEGYLTDCECNLSRLYLEWQPPHGQVLALRHAQAALALAQGRRAPMGLVRSLCTAAMAEAWAGSADRARDLAEEALRVAQGAALTAVLGEAQLALGQAAKAAGDPTRARAAFVAAEPGVSRVAAQKIGLELDRLTGDVGRARARLSWFEAQGLHGGAHLARRLFPELQKTPAGPPGPSTDVNTRRLEVLGPLQFTGEPVRGRKRRELLALLLEARMAGRPELPRLELIEALYPGVAETQATTALRDLVYQLRAEHGSGLIQTTSGGYALGDISLDAEDFLQGGDTRLWRGPYLTGLDVSEQGVRDALYLTLQGRAENLLAHDPRESARLGRLLLEADPYDQASLHLTLRALRAARNHKSLNRTYEEARARLLDVGEALPEHWAEFLAKEDSTASVP